MTRETSSKRRGLLKGMAAVLIGAGLMSLFATPTEAARYRYRGGYRYNVPRYYARPFVARPFVVQRPFNGYGYAPRVYTRGYYRAPYLVPSPYAPVLPY